MDTELDYWHKQVHFQIWNSFILYSAGTILYLTVSIYWPIYIDILSKWDTKLVVFPAYGDSICVYRVSTQTNIYIVVSNDLHGNKTWY